MKFYTSSVPFAQSVSRIEALLVANGATNIMKEYGPKGELEALAFSIKVDGNLWHFKLPARVREIEKLLAAKIRRQTETAMKEVRAQAERTAWKLTCEWVDIEMTMIQLHQRTILEVFLPCIYDVARKQTFFQLLEERKFKGLLPERT